MKFCKFDDIKKQTKVVTKNTYSKNSTLSKLSSFIEYPNDNQFINGILWGTKWTNIPKDEITYTINWGNSLKKSIIEDEKVIEFIEPTMDTRNSVFQCMNDLAEFINLKVRYTEDINETILSFNFLNGDKVGYLGYAIPPNPNYNSNRIDEYDDTPGNIFIKYDKFMNFQKGSYNYITIVHELGHAMGLAHPFDNGGTSTVYDGVQTSFGDFGDYDANLQPLTIMTYNDISSPYVPNTSDSTTGFLATFGPIDIVTLQFLYGKNTNFNIGNNTYKFPNNSDGKMWETIWDSGGINTIDASTSNANTIINLNDATIKDNTKLAGTFLSYNIFGGITISKGTKIHNVITGTKDDTITGNEHNNKIVVTEGGLDIIDGKDGYDTVIINNDSDKFSIEEKNKEVILEKENHKLILKNCEKIIFKDREYIIGDMNDSIKNIKLLSDISSYGRINVNHKWKTIFFGKSFKNPVIILSDPTLNGSDSVVTIIQNITSTSCQIKLREPTYKDGKHLFETISYIIGEKGTYKIGNKIMEFGLKKGVGKKFETISFSSVYLSKPSIFTQLQTKNNNDWIVTRNRFINKNNFQVKLQKEEKRRNTNYKNETIGWMSITQGFENEELSTFESRTVQNMTNKKKKIKYTNSFDSIPFLITKITTFKGEDPCNSRIINNSKKSFMIKVYEEKSKDKEVYHKEENISYFAYL